MTPRSQAPVARGRQDVGIARGRPRRGAARPSTRAEDGRGPVARGRRGRLVGAQPSTRAVAGHRWEARLSTWAVAGRREEARHRTRASAGQRRGGARPSTRTGVGRCLVARRRHGVSRVRCSTVATERRGGMAEQGAVAAASAVRQGAVARVHGHALRGSVRSELEFIRPADDSEESHAESGRRHSPQLHTLHDLHTFTFTPTHTTSVHHLFTSYYAQAVSLSLSLSFSVIDPEARVIWLEAPFLTLHHPLLSRAKGLRRDIIFSGGACRSGLRQPWGLEHQGRGRGSSR